jgi:CHASE2 domain-containing sensor protein
LALVLAWLFQAGLQRLHFFDRYDEADADHYARTIPVSPKSSDHIVIVGITENDYRELFGAHSPLDTGKLLNLVKTLQSYQPRIIGVDFLTADWPAPLPESLVHTVPTIVWARDGIGDSAPSDANEFPEFTQWNGVVGYATPPAGLCFAAPVNQPDPDGVIRSYSNVVVVHRPGTTATAIFPTMAYVLASEYSGLPFNCQSDPDPEVRRIRFTGENHNIRVLFASDVLRDAQHARKFEKYLVDRIVLIGGMFAGRDQFASGGVYRSGVSILAHAVESEISGSIRELPAWVSLPIALGVSIFLYFLVSPLRSPMDVLVSVAFLIGFSFFTGWFCYDYLRLFLPIASGLFSLPIGIVFEHHVACKHEEH